MIAVYAHILFSVNINYITTITIKSMQDGNLELIWGSSKKSINEKYYVSVQSRHMPFVEKIVTEKYILIKGLKNCEKYTAIVKILGSKIWRIVQFTYKSQTKSPKNIEYDYSRFLLNWSYYSEYCFSSWFYVIFLNNKID
ncbi:hypothetical protein HZS_7230 [Henneguya salminicola]|nr:hypothetical protein HZS_7230 [Henneguya salminicola]